MRPFFNFWARSKNSGNPKIPKNSENPEFPEKNPTDKS